VFDGNRGPSDHHIEVSGDCMASALVSVVTPFHNTVDYLAGCIDSVLAQTYTNFEYILVDNASTDGSGKIAEAYAGKDSRIRFFHRKQLLGQVENYNASLKEISSESEYCKIVQADDAIFPDCLRLMVITFQRSEAIGLVSSYWICGEELCGSGFPYPTNVLSGRRAAQLYLRTGVGIIGSPTNVMYKSSIVRSRKKFYDVEQQHEDSDACMRILKSWDFGFVHQVLSFSRRDNQSISSAIRPFDHMSLAKYILAQRWAEDFFEKAEAKAFKRRAKRIYYRRLASAAFQPWRVRFWRYHRDGLRTIGEEFCIDHLVCSLLRKLGWIVANPGATVLRLLQEWQRRKRCAGE
jgi:glycosyltransferase involved in cell wall biosynthesis